MFLYPKILHGMHAILRVRHKRLTFNILSRLWADIKYHAPTIIIFYHQGFFAVKRRAVFILEATWKALVRGWRSDCVVGGMETRFQWRKAHNPYAKCEAFHIAPRLFFMFLFLIPLTIRLQSIIYPHKFSTDPRKGGTTFYFSGFVQLLCPCIYYL